MLILHGCTLRLLASASSVGTWPYCSEALVALVWLFNPPCQCSLCFTLEEPLGFLVFRNTHTHAEPARCRLPLAPRANWYQLLLVFWPSTHHLFLFIIRTCCCWCCCCLIMWMRLVGGGECFNASGALLAEYDARPSSVPR